MTVLVLVSKLPYVEVSYRTLRRIFNKCDGNNTVRFKGAFGCYGDCQHLAKSHICHIGSSYRKGVGGGGYSDKFLSKFCRYISPAPIQGLPPPLKDVHDGTLKMTVNRTTST